MNRSNHTRSSVMCSGSLTLCFPNVCKRVSQCVFVSPVHRSQQSVTWRCLYWSRSNRTRTTSSLSRVSCSHSPVTAYQALPTPPLPAVQLLQCAAEIWSSLSPRWEQHTPPVELTGTRTSFKERSAASVMKLHVVVMFKSIFTVSTVTLTRWLTETLHTDKHVKDGPLCSGPFPHRTSFTFIFTFVLKITNQCHDQARFI